MVAEITVLVFWTAFFGALSTRNIWLKKADPVYERMERLLDTQSHTASGILASENDSPAINRLRHRLVLAGFKRHADLQHLLRFQNACRLIPFLIMVVLFFMNFPASQILLLGSLSAVIFLLIPRVWLIYHIRHHRKMIEKHLPDMLDLFTLCLEAGLSFDSSLVRVAEEQKRVCPHMSQELIQTNQEILAGKSREEALKNLSERTGIEDMKNLIAAVLQSIKLGTSLVKTFRVQAQVLRKNRRERIRALILKTPVKLIFPLLLFIFPTLLIVILGPSLIHIFRHLTKVGI